LEEDECPCPKNCLGADLEKVEGMEALVERKDGRDFSVGEE